MIANLEGGYLYEFLGPQRFLRTAATEICYGAQERPSRKLAGIVNICWAILREGRMSKEGRNQMQQLPSQSWPLQAQALLLFSWTAEELLSTALMTVPRSQ